MKKETIKGIIIGVISSLIASGLIYFFTKEWIWNYNIPLWICLVLTILVYLLFKLTGYLRFKHRLQHILSEYREGYIGNTYPYTWEFRKSKGEYNVYGYEPYQIRIKDETKERLSQPNVYVFDGHDVPEVALKRYIQLQIVYAMNNDIRTYIMPTLEYLHFTQDSQKHQIIY